MTLLVLNPGCEITNLSWRRVDEGNLTVQSNWAQKFQFSCLNFQNAGITDVHGHSSPKNYDFFLMLPLLSFNLMLVHPPLSISHSFFPLTVEYSLSTVVS